MNKTQHTPGPWRQYLPEPDDSYCLIFSECGGITVAQAERWNRENETERTEAEANARLIASAPELLYALESLTSEINLRKLNIRKDFSLLNAHAYATKVILEAKGE